MKCVALFIVLAVVMAVNSSPDPGVHRVTGKFVTHVHHYRIPGKGGRGGQGGRGGPGGDGGPPKPPKGGKGGNGGKDGKCQKGLVTGTADKVNKGFQGLTGGIANAFGANKKKPGLIGNIFGGAKTLLDNIAGGADQAVSDFFCGFNRVFNKIGSKAGKGDLLGGIVSGANTFVSGAGSFFGNIGTNALGAVTSGVSDAVHGRRGKKGIIHSTHGRRT